MKSKEFGGYIELDTYRLPMLHEDAIALNCGRNCLAYIIKAKHIRKIWLPFFMCDSVFDTCKKYGVKMFFYHIDNRFMVPDVNLSDDEWLYVTNYYGQLTEVYISKLKANYRRIIVDNAQAYYDSPVKDVDTIYTCRKYFGVADGALLYTDVELEEDFPRDESFERMRFLLGRFERSASEFYDEYSENNGFFNNEPIKRMSKLTRNLLHGIDYNNVKQQRSDNYSFYHKELESINELVLREVEGAFAYPLMVKHGSLIRKELQKKQIYIPTLWPNVVNEMPEGSIEHRLSTDILPLPCDQRYVSSDVEIIIQNVIELLGY